jgi:hypothetical protein
MLVGYLAILLLLHGIAQSIKHVTSYDLETNTVKSSFQISRPSAVTLESVSSNLFMKLIAGGASPGYTGDGTAATSAMIVVSSFWLDSSGTIYIADEFKNKIRKISSNGIISYFGGTGTQSWDGISGPIGSVNFNSQYSIVGDAAGTFLYINDGYYIWKYMFGTNIATVYAQAKLNGFTGFSGDNGPATSASLSGPQHLWLTTAGTLYFADFYNNRIRKITSSGTISTVVGSGAGGDTGSFAGDGNLTTTASLNRPRGVYVDTAGKIFIADTLNHRIRLVDANNIITTFAGTGIVNPFNGDNIPALMANLNNPSDMKGDTVGNIYVVDNSHRLVRVVDTSGIISTVFGNPDNGGFTAGVSPPSSNINFPWTIWLDSLSNIYFSDYNSIHRSVVVASPTSQPSQQPTTRPTHPTSQPSTQPSRHPSTQPSSHPSRRPTTQPSSSPSGQPTRLPTHPTSQPSALPSGQPSSQPVAKPSGRPSNQPSGFPTGLPTRQPSSRPSSQPTRAPSCQPTSQPSRQPTSGPMAHPSSNPSNQPTAMPSSKTTSFPSSQPSGRPTRQPSRQPTSKPSEQPSGHPSNQPTNCPTRKPSSQSSQQPSTQPTRQPFARPTSQPSNCPSCLPTAQPSRQPPSRPTAQPTTTPSTQPTEMPSSQPSVIPSRQPSSQPTGNPSVIPSSQPSAMPTMQPTNRPTVQPSSAPSLVPTGLPSSQPSMLPSSQPTSVPSVQPSSYPSVFPTMQPSALPSSLPSERPSSQPSPQPSNQPSALPSRQPTSMPSVSPSRQPTSSPSGQPTVSPSSQPSAYPSSRPSVLPTSAPTNLPTFQPTGQPSTQPTSVPSLQPSAQPTVFPSAFPTSQPSGQPSCHPTMPPTDCPSSQPSCHPSVQPTVQPTGSPTSQPWSFPTDQPTTVPSIQPSNRPSCQPSMIPTGQPLAFPTAIPSGQPSSSPSQQPRSLPTSSPTTQPTSIPSAQPFALPTSAPVANIYQSKGVLFFPSDPIYSNQPFTENSGSLGSTYILFGRNTKHGERFRFTIPLESEGYREYFSLLHDETGGITRDTVTRSTTILGDINNDGFLDLLLGYPLDSKCFVYLGNSAGIENRESFKIIGDSDRGAGKLGWASARVGDLNHDGFDEIAISAPFSNVVYFISGKEEFNDDILIHELGSSDGFKITGSAQDTDFGVALNLVHDFNKDGFQDIAITAVRPGGQNVIYILLGHATFGKKNVQIDQLLAMKQETHPYCFRILSPYLSYAGFSIAGIGDINNDGYNDLAIGSIPVENAKFGKQRTYIIYGREMNMTILQQDLFLAEMTVKDGFIVTGGGFLIEPAGDVNADGIADVMITGYDDWKGKGNAFIINYPKNVTHSPICQPSSSPSSLPSGLPSTIPTNYGYSSFPTTAQESINGNSSSSFRNRSSLTPTMFTTMKPSVVPSYSPTLSIAPSFPPTVVPSRKPTATPTNLRMIPTVLPSQSSVPTDGIRYRTKSPTAIPTVRTITNTTSSGYIEYTDIMCSKAGHYEGRNETNYKFLIATSNGTVKITGQNSAVAKNLYLLFCPQIEWMSLLPTSDYPLTVLA